MNENIEIILRGKKIKKLIDRRLLPIRKRYELRQVEIEILLYLKRWPKASASEMSRRLLINKGHVSKAMDNLSKKGFIHSEQNEWDRRYVTFTVTELGERIICESESIENQLAEMVLRDVTEEERETMKRISEKMSQNIDNIEKNIDEI